MHTLTHLQLKKLESSDNQNFLLGAFVTLTACLFASRHQRWWLWPNWHIFKRDAIAFLSLYYYYLSWTRKSALCDIALREFFFWEATKVVLHANANLLIQICLAYLPGPSEERLLRIGKVSVTASDVRNVGKKSNFVLEIEIPKNLSTSVRVHTKTRNLLKTLMLRYLRKVQRISGEFLAERSTYILCCDWNFSPRVFFSFSFFFSSANDLDKYGEQLACMYISCK